MRQRNGVSTLGIIGGLLVLLMVAATACDDPERGDAGERATLTPTHTSTPTSNGTPALTVEDLERRRSIWEARNLRDYQIDYQNKTFLPPEEMKPVFITVRSSSIESVVYQSNGQPVQEGSYPDVEGLFELVQDAISLKYEEISVTFDPQLGYPTSAWLSWDRRVADGGVGFTARVRPLPVSIPTPTTKPTPELTPTSTPPPTPQAVVGASPESLAAIEALPWVRAGRQLEAVAQLQHMAMEAPWAVVRRPWMQVMQNDFTWDRVVPINFIRNIAQIDEEAAAQIVELPFLETVEIEDLMALETLQSLFLADPAGARQLLSDPALLNGMRSSPAATVALLYLKAEDPGVSAAIQALPWVQDGIAPYGDIFPSKTSLEPAVILGLMQLYWHSREACLALVRSSWFYDGLDNREYTALGNLATIAYRDGEAAARLVEMPFLETFERNDLLTIQILEWLPKSDLQELLSDPALRGGITDEHVGTVALLHLRLQDHDAAAQIESLSWVQDGMVASEGPHVQSAKASCVGFPRSLLEPRPEVMGTRRPEVR